MKTTKYILGIMMSTTLLFTGCMKDDIDELRELQTENAARIAALETWQQTVNGNISALQGLVAALQNNDYVTGVSAFTTPAPGGYRITFTKSGEATIWNGTKGDTGDTGAAGHSPVVAVKQDADGKYYWTLDGEWISDNGNKMPVTGEKGDSGKTAYELAVENGYAGTLDEWLASLNGTNGANGKSAYELAVEKGYSGTESEWLASLQGIGGADGISAYELAVENGYTGTESEWLASLNGTNGANGKSAYQQAVDNGYTGTQAQWLASLQGAVGATGATGKTPKVAIGSDNYWYISADGTATGTPPGTGWISTNVKATGNDGATGPQGPVGPQGDAIFAANGVDNSHDDFVVFTLADGTNTITLPKYKAISISYSQPGAFIAGQEYRVPYISTGTAKPTDVRVSNIPSGWAVTVDKATSAFVITPPANFGAAGVEFGKATIWLDEGNKIGAMYNLELQNRRISGNTIGEYFYQNGAITGVIYKANDGTPNSGTVMCLTHTMFFMWADINNLTFETGATDATNGFNNMKTIASLVRNNTKVWSNFPPFAETHKRNDPAETYSESSVAGVWYLPAIDEWTEFYNIFFTYGQSSFNILLTSAGGNSIGQFYWSSTEKSAKQVYLFDQISSTKELILNKNGGTFYVRGICRF